MPIAAKAGANAALLIFKKEDSNAFKVLAGYMDSKISLQKLLASGCFKPYDNSWVQPLTPAQRRTAYDKANSEQYP